MHSFNKYMFAFRYITYKNRCPNWIFNIIWIRKPSNSAENIKPEKCTKIYIFVPKNYAHKAHLYKAKPENL
jgi:hypothetical protein